MAAMPATVPAGSAWTEPDGGMFTWVRLPGAADTATLLPAALARDVAFVPGAPFFAGRPDTATMRLSFTTHTPAEIAEGMRRLSAVLRTPAAGSS
jgi:2-aminoadipate transaminase